MYLTYVAELKIRFCGKNSFSFQTPNSKFKIQKGFESVNQIWTGGMQFSNPAQVFLNLHLYTDSICAWSNQGLVMCLLSVLKQ